MGPRRRMLRFARPVKSGSPGAGDGGRSGASGRGTRKEEERPRGWLARRRRRWQAARSCRRGRPAGAGAGSRAATGGASPPLPGVVAAGPVAGRRGGLACRPGPQASTLHSARPVKSQRPGAGAGLPPDPQPRVETSRDPPRQEGAPPGPARPPGGPHGGRAPRRCSPPSYMRPPPRSTLRARPAAGSPLCWLRDRSLSGCSRLTPISAHLRNRVLKGPFHSHWEIGAGGSRATRLCRYPATVSVLPPGCRCLCRLDGLLVSAPMSGDRVWAVRSTACEPTTLVSPPRQRNG